MSHGATSVPQHRHSKPQHRASMLNGRTQSGEPMHSRSHEGERRLLDLTVENVARSDIIRLWPTWGLGNCIQLSGKYGPALNEDLKVGPGAVVVVKPSDPRSPVFSGDPGYSRLLNCDFGPEIIDLWSLKARS